jgi:hypothetical protein
MINVDYVNIDQSEAPLQPNGFLQILANLTRTGVFTYFEKSPDGTIRVIRQLRHPDEVFAETTLYTLMGLPATNLHPTELVSPENAKELVVGMTSDTPKKISLDNDPESYVQQQVTFHDPESIRQIMAKERTELSLGYVCELDESPGEWNGVAYDFIQRNISYNHLSLVDRARGGAQCKVLLDDNEKEQHIWCDGLSFSETEGEQMKVFIADGKEFKVEDNVFDLLKGLHIDAETNKTSLSTKQSDFDKLQANFDELKSRYDSEDDKETKAKAVSVFNDAVAARVGLETKAKKVLDSEDFSGVADRTIKEKVIKHINPDVTLDGKSDDYVDARFDIAIEGYKAPTKEGEIGKGLNTNTDGHGVGGGYEAARKRQWDRDKKLWEVKA